MRWYVPETFKFCNYGRCHPNAPYAVGALEPSGDKTGDVILCLNGR